MRSGKAQRNIKIGSVAPDSRHSKPSRNEDSRQQQASVKGHYMGYLDGAILGLLGVALWHIGHGNLNARRIERKLDALLKQSGVELTQFDLREAADWQRDAP